MTWDIHPSGEVLAEVRKRVRRKDAEADLRAQTIRWAPGAWATDLPNQRELIEVVRAESVPEADPDLWAVTREQVMDLARRDDAMLTFMAAMIWGFGTGGRRWLARAALGYPVGRRGRRMEPKGAIRRIQAGYELAQEDAVRAFGEVVAGECHPWGIGQSYASKYVYVAGFEHAVADGRLAPLVLDRWVTTALFATERRTSSAQNYRAYLEFAKAVSDGRRADLVEFALFEIGQGD